MSMFRPHAAVDGRGPAAFLRWGVIFAGILLSDPGLVRAQSGPQPESPPKPESPPETKTPVEPESPPNPKSPSETPNKPDTAAPPPAATGGVIPPKLAKQVRAVYPAKALTDRVYARIVVELLISATGEIDSARVVDSTITAEDGTKKADDAYQFGEAALAAAFQLRFEPAKLNGEAIEVEINYTFHFKLPDLQTEGDTGATKTPETSPVVNFTGRLIERGTRATLAGIVVTAYRDENGKTVGFDATSDKQGRFRFYNLGAGVWQVRIAADGYYRFETTEEIKANQLVETSYYVERRSYNPYDVLVEAPRPQKEVTRRTLTSAEIATVPGTLGDPVLVIENLPGVARPELGSGELIVRGSGPEDTGILVDGINVPLIYHFGGLKSVLPAKVIESIDFYPGNFSVRYGRALGGVFDAHVKRLEPDRHHGSADISLLDTSLYFEFPIGDNAAIAFAGRRSYIDLVLNAVVPEDSSVGLVNAPRYYDFQILGNWRPKPAHDLRALFFGSDDRIELLFADPTDDIGVVASSGRAAAKTRFQRLTFEYGYIPSASFKNHLKVGIGHDVFDADIFGDFRLDIKLWQFQARDTATWKWNQYLQLNAGVDVLLSLVDGFVNAPIRPQEGELEPDFEPDDFVSTSFKNRVLFSAAPFLEAEITWGDLRIVPGFRVDYFRVADQVTFDPRIVARYQLGDWAIKAGVGIVHQEAPFDATDKEVGNPDLDAQDGVHYSIGAEWKPLEYLSIDANLFYKDLNNLVDTTNSFVTRDGERVAQVFDNSRTGRVYGGELFVRHTFANNFRGWVSYTLSRAERFDKGSSDARLFDHDQTHIFAAVGSYRLPRNWEVGLRWRFVSGRPETPVIGSTFVNEIDQYLPILGEINSDRLGAFHQLDLRADKTWVFRNWKLSAYLSLINAYNRKNIEETSYNFDFSEKGGASGLPIFPILGVKGEW